MIANRQEAALNIAIMNRLSKTVLHQVRLGSEAGILEALQERFDFTKAAKDLIVYMKSDKDRILYEQAICLADTAEFLEFAGKTRDRIVKQKLTAIYSSIDQLHEFGYKRQREECLYPSLEPFLSEPETHNLLQRSVTAGLLDEKFQPKKGTKIYQLKLIAEAIIQIRGIGTRNKWCHFEKQWRLGEHRLSQAFVPLTRSNSIYRISKIYPEVDFYSLLTQKDYDKTFSTDLNEVQCRELWRRLKDANFIDQKVEVESFLAMTGIIKLPTAPVNWTGSFDSLVYFVNAVFGDLNPSVLHITADLFVIKNAPINYGTMKTKSSRIKRHPEMFDFIPVLDDIIMKSRQKK
jgi:hypothetical protein